MKNIRFVPTLLCALGITSLSFVACGVTPGRPIAVTFFVQGASNAAFETAAGYQIQLDEAWLSIGPIYVLAPTHALTRLERALALPVALAHGGHDDYASLGVRAEWLGEQVVSAIGGTQLLVGAGDGVAGLAEYTTLDLVVPADASGPTHGHIAWVAGTATPIAGGDPIAFEGGLDLPDEALSRTIESIASALDMSETGTFTLALHPNGRGADAPSWLEEASFDRLPAPASGTTRELAPGTQPYVAWTLALRDAVAYTTSYQPGASR